MATLSASKPDPLARAPGCLVDYDDDDDDDIDISNLLFDDSPAKSLRPISAASPPVTSSLNRNDSGAPEVLLVGTAPTISTKRPFDAPRANPVAPLPTVDSISPVRPMDALRSDAYQLQDAPRSDPCRPLDAPRTDPADSLNTPPADSFQSPDAPRLNPLRPPDAPRTDPTRSMDAPRSDPARPSDAPHSDPFRPAGAPQTDPVRSVNALRTDPAGAMDPLQTDPSRATHPMQTNPSRATDAPLTRPVDMPRTDSIRSTDAPHKDPSRSMDAMRTDPVRSIDALRTDPVRPMDPLRANPPSFMDATRTDPLRSMDALWTDPVRPLKALRTDSVRSMDAPRTDSVRPFDAPRSDPVRPLETQRIDHAKSMDAPQAEPAKPIDASRSDPVKPVCAPRTDSMRSMDALRTDPVRSKDVLRTKPVRPVDASWTDSMGSVDALRTDLIRPMDAFRTDPVRPIDAPRTDIVRPMDAPRSDPVRPWDTSRTDPMRSMDAPRTGPMRSMDGLQTDPVRPLDAPRTDPVRSMNDPREDSVRSMDAPQTDPVRPKNAAHADPVKSMDASRDASRTDPVRAVDAPCTDPVRLIDNPSTGSMRPSNAPHADTDRPLGADETEPTRNMNAVPTDPASAAYVSRTEEVSQAKLPHTDLTRSMVALVLDPMKRAYAQGASTVSPLSTSHSADPTRPINAMYIDQKDAPRSHPGRPIDTLRSDPMKSVDARRSDPVKASHSLHACSGRPLDSPYLCQETYNDTLRCDAVKTVDSDTALVRDSGPLPSTPSAHAPLSGILAHFSPSSGQHSTNTVRFSDMSTSGLPMDKSSALSQHPGRDGPPVDAPYTSSPTTPIAPVALPSKGGTCYAPPATTTSSGGTICATPIGVPCPSSSITANYSASIGTIADAKTSAVSLPVAPKVTASSPNIARDAPSIKPGAPLGTPSVVESSIGTSEVAPVGASYDVPDSARVAHTHASSATSAPVESTNGISSVPSGATLNVATTPAYSTNAMPIAPVDTSSAAPAGAASQAAVSSLSASLSISDATKLPTTTQTVAASPHVALPTTPVGAAPQGISFTAAVFDSAPNQETPKAGSTPVDVHASTSAALPAPAPTLATDLPLGSHVVDAAAKGSHGVTAAATSKASDINSRIGAPTSPTTPSHPTPSVAPIGIPRSTSSPNDTSADIPHVSSAPSESPPVSSDPPHAPAFVAASGTPSPVASAQRTTPLTHTPLEVEATALSPITASTSMNTRHTTHALAATTYSSPSSTAVLPKAPATPITPPDTLTTRTPLPPSTDKTPPVSLTKLPASTERNDTPTAATRASRNKPSTADRVPNLSTHASLSPLRAHSANFNPHLRPLSASPQTTSPLSVGSEKIRRQVRMLWEGPFLTPGLGRKAGGRSPPSARAGRWAEGEHWVGPREEAQIAALESEVAVLKECIEAAKTEMPRQIERHMEALHRKDVEIARLQAARRKSQQAAREKESGAETAAAASSQAVVDLQLQNNALLNAHAAKEDQWRHDLQEKNAKILDLTRKNEQMAGELSRTQAVKENLLSLSAEEKQVALALQAALEQSQAALSTLTEKLKEADEQHRRDQALLARRASVHFGTQTDIPETRSVFCMTDKRLGGMDAAPARETSFAPPRARTQQSGSPTSFVTSGALFYDADESRARGRLHGFHKQHHRFDDAHFFATNTHHAAVPPLSAATTPVVSPAPPAVAPLLAPCSPHDASRAQTTFTPVAHKTAGVTTAPTSWADTEGSGFTVRPTTEHCTKPTLDARTERGAGLRHIDPCPERGETFPASKGASVSAAPPQPSSTAVARISREDEERIAATDLRRPGVEDDDRRPHGPNKEPLGVASPPQASARFRSKDVERKSAERKSPPALEQRDTERGGEHTSPTGAARAQEQQYGRSSSYGTHRSYSAVGISSPSHSHSSTFGREPVAATHSLYSPTVRCDGHPSLPRAAGLGDLDLRGSSKRSIASRSVVPLSPQGSASAALPARRWNLKRDDAYFSHRPKERKAGHTAVDARKSPNDAENFGPGRAATAAAAAAARTPSPPRSHRTPGSCSSPIAAQRQQQQQQRSQPTASTIDGVRKKPPPLEFLAPISSSGRPSPAHASRKPESMSPPQALRRSPASAAMVSPSASVSPTSAARRDGPPVRSNHIQLPTSPTAHPTLKRDVQSSSRLHSSPASPALPAGRQPSGAAMRTTTTS